MHLSLNHEEVNLNESSIAALNVSEVVPRFIKIQLLMAVKSGGTQQLSML